MPNKPSPELERILHYATATAARKGLEVVESPVPESSLFAPPAVLEEPARRAFVIMSMYLRRLDTDPLIYLRLSARHLLMDYHHPDAQSPNPAEEWHMRIIFESSGTDFRMGVECNSRNRKTADGLFEAVWNARGPSPQTTATARVDVLIAAYLKESQEAAAKAGNL